MQKIKKFSLALAPLTTIPFVAFHVQMKDKDQPQPQIIMLILLK